MKSAPFKSVAPFKARSTPQSAMYHAFGVNYINPPEPTRYGCLAVLPQASISSTALYGGTPVPETVIYVLTNTGGATMSWSATITGASAWLSVDVASGSLDPGESVNVTVTLDASALPMDAYSDSIEFVNTTNGCGDFTPTVSLSVTGTIPLSMEYRSKNGTATMIGFSEFNGAESTPPKKYRRLASTGDTRICYRTGLSCVTALALTDSYDFNVADVVYNVVTGVPNVVPIFHYVQTPGTCAFSTAGGALAAGNVTQRTALTQPGYTITITSTLYTRVGDNTCVTTGPNYYFLNGTTSQTLSDEDTETNAITRLDAAVAYGAWAAVAVVGDGAGAYEERTAGFSFDYTQSEWRATAAGLYPSTTYNGQVDIYKRAYGTADPWVFDSVIFFSSTTDGTGNLSYTAPVPDTPGYEFCVFDAILN